jgi:hypothetical protein
LLPIPRFTLAENVTANVQALRTALGSVAKPLSWADFARALIENGGRETLNASTAHGWGQGAEPDLQSIAIMARMAGVTFEEFALGPGSRSDDRPDYIKAAEIAGAVPASDAPFRRRAMEAAAENEAATPKKRVAGEKGPKKR